MLRHIVMISFSDREKLESTAVTAKQLLLDLEDSIGQLLKMEVGLNFSTRATAYDLVLIADFNNEKDLDFYRVHPEHIKVLDYLKTVVDKTTVVDYTI